MSFHLLLCCYHRSLFRWLVFVYFEFVFEFGWFCVCIRFGFILVGIVWFYWYEFYCALLGYFGFVDLLLCLFAWVDCCLDFVFGCFACFLYFVCYLCCFTNWCFVWCAFGGRLLLIVYETFWFSLLFRVVFISFAFVWFYVYYFVFVSLGIWVSCLLVLLMVFVLGFPISWLGGYLVALLIDVCACNCGTVYVVTFALVRLWVWISGFYCFACIWLFLLFVVLVAFCLGLIYVCVVCRYYFVVKLFVFLIWLLGWFRCLGWFVLSFFCVLRVVCLWFWACVI